MGVLHPVGSGAGAT